VLSHSNRGSAVAAHGSEVVVDDVHGELISTPSVVDASGFQSMMDVSFSRFLQAFQPMLEPVITAAATPIVSRSVTATAVISATSTAPVKTSTVSVSPSAGLVECLSVHGSIAASSSHGSRRGSRESRDSGST